MKKALCIVLSLVMVLSLCAFASADDTVTIRFCNNLSATDDLNVQINAAIERIAERTDGKLVIENYPGGTLLNYGDAVEAIMSDAAVMYFCSIGDWADYIPDQTILQSGFLYQNAEVYEKLMETEVFQDIFASCEDVNLHCVQPGFIGGFRYIMANKEVNTLDDLKGMKIRVPNVSNWLNMYNSLGANPVGMSSSETLQALQTGVIDGVDQTIAQYYQGGYNEVCKVVNLAGGMLLADNIWCSATFWNGLPEEYKAAITEEFGVARDTYSANSASLEAQYREELTAEGITFHEIDIAPFVEATRGDILAFGEVGEALVAQVEAVEAELGL